MFTIAGYILLSLGFFLTFTTILGFARFTNVYTRIHIGTINDMLGIPLAMLGVASLFAGLGDFFTAIKLCVGILVWYITTPITSYMIIKIVYFYSEKDE